MHLFLRRVLFTAALSAAFGVSQATVVFNFSSVYAGDTPSGSHPWASLTITDGANAGDVNFSLTNLMSHGSGQFLSYLELNLNANPSGTTMPTSNWVYGWGKGENYKTDEGQKFDYKIAFPSNDGDLLKGGDTATWTFHKTGITEESFVALSTPAGEDHHAGVYALLRVGGVGGHDGGGGDAFGGTPSSDGHHGCDGGGGDGGDDHHDDHGWSKLNPTVDRDVVPEPASMATLAIGALALLRKRRS